MIVVKYPPGRPAQFVLATADHAVAAGYYGRLFGWDAEPDGTFLLRGEPVARLAVGTGGWLPHLAVADLDGALADARAAGATVLDPQVRVPGRAAVVVDPTATPVGLWEADSGPAARLWAEDGAVVWVEQKTRDQRAAQTFLNALFDGEFVGPEGPGAVRVLKLDGPPRLGVMQFDDRWAADHPSHWLLYFHVDDLGSALARSAEAGGTVWFPPFDTPLGRMAYLRDPAGHALAVVHAG